MKRFIILALIAVGCAVKQEVRYTRPWPTPEEVRHDLGIPETDPIEAFTFDSTLTFEPLNSAEIAVLDSARLAYFEAVQDSFPDMRRQWWATCVYCWLQDTYDSLAVIGKAGSSYQEYLRKLEDEAMYNWFFIPLGFGTDGNFSFSYEWFNDTSRMSLRQWDVHPVSDSLFMFKASTGQITRDPRSK